MKFKIYNTLFREIQEFIPIDDNLIKIYSCGPTVYSQPHIGNFKSLLFSDLLRNTLKYICKYNVKHIMNITDVGHLVSDGDDGEDKMQKGARIEGLTAWEIAKKYESKFVQAMNDLNIEMFDKMPRATEHIQEQIDLILKLQDKGYTYIINGDGIYMDTSKVENYGKLIGPNYKKHIEGLKLGARINNKHKLNSTDFALWKFTKQGEQRDMERDSPWGKGYPGRHIECSAMSYKYLGNTFDIHVGGPEHISVHHTNEIAQSECGYNTNPWVNYRVHHGVLTIDGTKISKSLGHSYSLEDLKNNGIFPEDLRLFFMQAHYRSFQNFTREGLQATHKHRIKLQNKILDFLKSNNLDIKDIKNYQNIDLDQDLSNILLQDLNTSDVLATINKIANNLDQNTIGTIYKRDKNILKIGLFKRIKNIVYLDIPQDIIDLANIRLDAKKSGNYDLSDTKRDEIQNKGYNILDTKDGYTIIKK